MIGKLKRRFVGISVVCVTVVILNVEVYSSARHGYVDFPAFDQQDGEYLKGYSDGANLYWRNGKPVDPRSVRMFLSVSYFPRGFQGGGALANGPEPTDLAIVRTDLRLQRIDDRLVINGVVIPPGKSYTRRIIHWAIRLWMLPTTLTEISNRGVFHCFRTVEGDHAINALYVWGQIKEGWTLNPAGPVSLLIGLWLIFKRNHNVRDESSA
jgi:hypothetical protein